jgi:AmpD protein
MVTINQGWILPARRCLSPNFNQRPNGCTIDLLVIHNISLPPEQFGGDHIERFFCNSLDYTVHPYFKTLTALTVSSHCLINREGELVQFVNLNDRAWHAGRSCFNGKSECNDFSIGIELEGADHIPYTQPQYRQLITTTRAIQQAYPNITKDRITGHSIIAPERKTDPGPAFDWQVYLSGLDVN